MSCVLQEVMSIERNNTCLIRLSYICKDCVYHTCNYKHNHFNETFNDRLGCWSQERLHLQTEHFFISVLFREPFFINCMDPQIENLHSRMSAKIHENKNMLCSLTHCGIKERLCVFMDVYGNIICLLLIGVSLGLTPHQHHTAHRKI